MLFLSHLFKTIIPFLKCVCLRIYVVIACRIWGHWYYLVSTTLICLFLLCFPVASVQVSKLLILYFQPFFPSLALRCCRPQVGEQQREMTLLTWSPWSPWMRMGTARIHTGQYPLPSLLLLHLCLPVYLQYPIKPSCPTGQRNVVLMARCRSDWRWQEEERVKICIKKSQLRQKHIASLPKNIPEPVKGQINTESCREQVNEWLKIAKRGWMEIYVDVVNYSSQLLLVRMNHKDIRLKEASLHRQNQLFSIFLANPHLFKPFKMFTSIFINFISFIVLLSTTLFTTWVFRNCVTLQLCVPASLRQCRTTWVLRSCWSRLREQPARQQKSSPSKGPPARWLPLLYALSFYRSL